MTPIGNRADRCWREMQEVMPLLLSDQDKKEISIIEKHITEAITDERGKMAELLWHVAEFDMEEKNDDLAIRKLSHDLQDSTQYGLNNFSYTDLIKALRESV